MQLFGSLTSINQGLLGEWIVIRRLCRGFHQLWILQAAAPTISWTAQAFIHTSVSQWLMFCLFSPPWFHRDSLSPCVDAPDCFDQGKKWIGIVQEVTWVLLAASEVAAHIFSFFGKHGKWFCSACREARHPPSLSCLTWEGLAFSGSAEK